MCWPQKSTLLGGIGQASLQAKRPTISDLDFAGTVESFIQLDFEKLPRRRRRSLPRQLYTGIAASGALRHTLAKRPSR
jgi:hypothetical protein